MSTYPDPQVEGRRRRGRPARIDRDAIVASAIELGLDSFSMQDVAERLGVTTPALYSHVGGRSEVVALATAALADRMEGFHSDASDWRTWLTEFAIDVRRHLAPLLATLAGDLRAPRTSAQVTVAEPGLQLLMAQGLSPTEASYCVWLTFRTALTAGPEGAPSFAGYVGDTGERLRGGRKLPATEAVHRALAADPAGDTFDFDLQVVLDGIAARIRRARAATRRAT